MTHYSVTPWRPQGSVYRSNGNINVTSGSRAASEVRDGPPGGWAAGRRASTSDIKGSGIRYYLARCYSAY